MADIELYNLDAYRYGGLDSSRHEIRLITFSFSNMSAKSATPTLPGWEIKHVSLGDGPKYLALSYAWGSSQKRNPISFNGCVHHVTESLKNFFEQFQHPQESLPLWIQKIQRDQGQGALSFWIDAICINQEDEREKTDQIRQMRSIYSQASQVIAWLGPAADQSSVAIRKLIILARDYYSRGFCVPLTEEFWGQGNRNKIEERSKFLSELTIHDRGDAYLPLTATLKLFQRSYWLRLWILQELSVCKQVLFVCGTDFLDWDYFATAMVPLGHLYAVTRMHVENFDDRWKFVERFSPGPLKIMQFKYGSELSRCDSRSLGLLDALYQASAFGFMASDPRDRVFALLGIAKDRDELAITADYSKPCSLVYIETAQAFLRQNDLRFLATVEYPRSQNSLPSWVPDWSVKSKSRCFSLDQEFDPPFRASGTLPPSIYMESDAQPIHLLSLLGVKVDEVDLALTASLKMELGADLQPNINPHIGWLDMFESLLRSSTNVSCYATISEKAEALWRTPILDHESTAHDATDIKAGPASQYAYKVLRGLISAPPGVDDYSWRRHESSSYWQKMEKGVYGKTAFVSRTGYLGLGPTDLQVRDLICIFCGATMPFILRPSAAGRYALVGEAYVHGIMYGEFMQGEREVETFVLE